MSIQAYFENPGSCAYSTSTHLACRYMKYIGKSIYISDYNQVIYRGAEGTVVLSVLLLASIAETAARAVLIPVAMLFTVIADQFTENPRYWQDKALHLSVSGTLFSGANIAFCAQGIWEAVSGKFSEGNMDKRIFTPEVGTRPEIRYEVLWPSIARAGIIVRPLGELNPKTQGKEGQETTIPLKF